MFNTNRQVKYRHNNDKIKKYIFLVDRNIAYNAYRIYILIAKFKICKSYLLQYFKRKIEEKLVKDSEKKRQKDGEREISWNLDI